MGHRESPTVEFRSLFCSLLHICTTGTRITHSSEIMEPGWCELPLSHIFSVLAASYAEEDYVDPFRNSIQYHPRMIVELKADATRRELFEFLAGEFRLDNSPLLSGAIRTRLQRQISAESRHEGEVRIRHGTPSQPIPNPSWEAETIPTWMGELELESDDPNRTSKIKVRLPRPSSRLNRNANVTPKSKVDAETSTPEPKPRRRYPSKGLLRPKINYEIPERAESIIPSIEHNTPTPPKSRDAGQNSRSNLGSLQECRRQSPRKRQRLASSDSDNSPEHGATVADPEPSRSPSAEIGAPGVSTPIVNIPRVSISAGFNTTPGIGTPRMGTDGVGPSGVGISAGGFNTPGIGTPEVGPPRASIPGVGIHAEVSTPGMGTPGVGTPGVGTPGVGTTGVGTTGVGLPAEISIPGLGTFLLRAGRDTPRIAIPGFGTFEIGTPRSIL